MFRVHPQVIHRLSTSRVELNVWYLSTYPHTLRLLDSNVVKKGK